MYGEKLGWFAMLMQKFQPAPLTVVRAELVDAELAELACQSKAEYAALRVQIHNITADYHANRIMRLRAFLAQHDRSIEKAPNPEEHIDFPNAALIDVHSLGM